MPDGIFHLAIRQCLRTSSVALMPINQGWGATEWDMQETATFFCLPLSTWTPLLGEERLSARKIILFARYTKVQAERMYVNYLHIIQRMQFFGKHDLTT